MNRNARRTLENCAAGNIELTTEDLAELKQAMTVNPVRGTRYWEIVVNDFYYVAITLASKGIPLWWWPKKEDLVENGDAWLDRLYHK
jgi:hypothetical protein